MDAFLKFLSTSAEYGKRLFISEAPYPVVLVWACFDSLPAIAGVTIVQQIGAVNEGANPHFDIATVLKANIKSDFPVIDVAYSEDVTKFIIDGEALNNEEAAICLSKRLGIKLGENPAKKPNDMSQITDPFHHWSRLVFDGIAVRKTDIDGMLLSPDLKKIQAVIEIKRSKKVPIGEWLPFMDRHATNSDYWNYIMCFTLCKMLLCDFRTFHHEVMNKEESFEEETPVELFRFKKDTLIAEETIKHFMSNNNRRTYKGIDFR